MTPPLIIGNRHVGIKIKNRLGQCSNVRELERGARYVQSLERALNILEVMAQEGDAMTVTELSEKVGLKLGTSTGF